MVDLYSFDDGITANVYAEEGEASAHVEIYFAPGDARAALRLLCRAVIAVLVEARKKDGVHV